MGINYCGKVFEKASGDSRSRRSRVDGQGNHLLVCHKSHEILLNWA